MRNGQNKRMRGRNNNNNRKGGGGGGGGSGHNHHNPLTRVYESNGPEVKIRGTAHHVAEKYVQLARDASASGDYVTAEAHHQHAEHYLRLIAAAQEQFRQQNPHYRPEGSEIDNRDATFEDGDDENGQPSQQGQPPQQGQPNFGNQQPQQPPFQTRENNQPYVPRDQSNSYGGQPNQGRPQHHQNNQNYQNNQNNQPPQQHQPQQQPYQQPQPPQPTRFPGTDVEQLPSFITGGQPQPVVQDAGQNGYDNNQGDRFPLHRRRRRHRPGGPRPDVPGGMGGDDAPGNSD